MLIKSLLLLSLAYGAAGPSSLQRHSSSPKIPLQPRSPSRSLPPSKPSPFLKSSSPISFLQSSVSGDLAHRQQLSQQHSDPMKDGNIPTLDVQMIAPKRWLASDREFKNLQRELSYFIDQEIDKERKRLLDKEDSRLESTRSSLLHLIPGSGKKSNKLASVS
ncbi:signal peptide-containing protein [Theileria equi strain WA]|uniref:Signal peptide-containing protein n=1 Tax=Theileria equi strain WA TaxID=1537102 RepID=L0B0Y4_THEEQ|nr:signal peptide-containing protein [Theileria equi strain WA]AFZ81475.1 signal peptide-containing protein [Theileria equi strain WA]|eukprot:XP_004831141.1 signal peptide-containing protein [Theileria equi strain WA]